MKKGQIPILPQFMHLTTGITFFWIGCTEHIHQTPSIPLCFEYKQHHINIGPLHNIKRRENKVKSCQSIKIFCHTHSFDPHQSDHTHVHH